MACHVFHDHDADPDCDVRTRAQLESARRVCKKLAAEELAEPDLRYGSRIVNGTFARLTKCCASGRYCRESAGRQAGPETRRGRGLADTAPVTSSSSGPPLPLAPMARCRCDPTRMPGPHRMRYLQPPAGRQHARQHRGSAGFSCAAAGRRTRVVRLVVVQVVAPVEDEAARVDHHDRAAKVGAGVLLADDRLGEAASRPGSAGRRIDTGLRQDRPQCRRCDPAAQTGKFSRDPPVSPGGVLGGHPQHQLASSSPAVDRPFHGRAMARHPTDAAAGQVLPEGEEGTADRAGGAQDDRDLPPGRRLVSAAEL